MEGVLNEKTNTVHKREPGRTALKTPCGIAYTVPQDRLRQTNIDQLVTTTTTTKCGRCFDDGSGY